MDNYEDAILPDDFEDTPVDNELEAESTTDEVNADDHFVEDATPTEDQEITETVEQEAQKLRIKYNHEEREIDLDEARELAQKGLNYEKAVERARQEARDAYIAEQGYEWNGQPITTEAAYNQALKERDLIEKYREQDLPDDVIQELIESKKFRDSYRSQQEQLEKEQHEKQQFSDFVEAFPDVDPKTISPDTWAKVEQGIPLKYAYLEQERAQLLEKAKVVEQNTINQQKAPIKGVTAFGAGEPEKASDPFLDGFSGG